MHNSTDVTSDKVFGFYFLDVAFCIMIFAVSYNKDKSIFYVAAMILISVIICICYAALGSKKDELKNIYLFFGILGIKSPLTFHIGCFLVANLSFKQKIILAFILLLLSILAYSFVAIITKSMILNAEKLPLRWKVSKATIAPAAVLGTAVSGILTRRYEKFIWIWCFAIMSLCLTLFTMYLPKCYYVIKLEKENKGKNIADD